MAIYVLFSIALRKEKRDKIISSKRFRFDENTSENKEHGFTPEIVSVMMIDMKTLLLKQMLR